MHHASVNMGLPSFYYFILHGVETLLLLFVITSFFLCHDLPQFYVKNSLRITEEISSDITFTMKSKYFFILISE